MATRTTPDQRAAAAADIEAGRKTVQEVADEFGVTPNTVKRWQRTATQTAQTAERSVPLIRRIADSYSGAPGPAASVATRIGVLLNIKHKIVLGILAATSRLAIAALIAVALWYLLEVDGDELDRAREKWVNTSDKLAFLADDIEGAVEGLTKDDAEWNTDDQKAFANHIKAYIEELRQTSRSAATNADTLKTIIDAVTIIFGSVLVVTLAIMVFVYAIAPLLATPAAPAAKAEQEVAGAGATMTITGSINAVVGVLGTVLPLIVMVQQSTRFEGNMKNVVGGGTQFKDIHINWNVTAVN
ncbi:helix-turn-helix domain-containing protein [Actinoplanes subglobosus]|uniref:Helix-turn-helix domain-containing protein n=1 Tax=Actinoplanes subglobosus TaxID=1547892 RepID=A0ABV8ILS3_9ACTN